MNKKLFALLASAAMMASFAPSVFAESNDQDVNPDEGNSSVAETNEGGETSEGGDNNQAEALNVSFTTSATKAAAGDEVAFNVVLDSAVPVEGLQFSFTAENAELVSFVADETVTKGLGFSSVEVDLSSDPHVITLPSLSSDPVAPNNAVIGTLTVKVNSDVEDGATVTVGAKDGVANYNDGDGTFAWNVAEGTVTVGAAESEASSEATSEASSVADSATSSTTSTTDSSSKATTNNSSKAGTNGTTSNTNTGAASTAAVALAASAAALVVISKKRK